MSNERFDIYATSDQSLSPGDARCPGPSPQDMLNRDMDTPPDALKQVKYEYLGSDDIPLSRYTDEAFYLSEVEHIWQKTWQWACREEHVTDVGDYYVYDICDDSVIIIRGEDLSLIHI